MSSVSQETRDAGCQRTDNMGETIICPSCGIQSKKIFSGGRYAICDNGKCNVTKFTVQDFKGDGNDEGNHNRSYNNSVR